MSPKRLSIFDIATMYEGEQDSAIAVPGARVKISTNRIYYGNKSTLSEFLAKRKEICKRTYVPCSKVPYKQKQSN